MTTPRYWVKQVVERDYQPGDSVEVTDVMGNVADTPAKFSDSDRVGEQVRQAMVRLRREDGLFQPGPSDETFLRV